VPEIGFTRWHRATCRVVQKHNELEFQKNAGIRMAQCQNMRNINGTVPIRILWITEFKNFPAFAARVQSLQRTSLPGAQFDLNKKAAVLVIREGKGVVIRAFIKLEIFSSLLIIGPSLDMILRY
jgi:hypothetical protein